MSTDSTPNNPVAADQQLTISELKNQLARYEQVLAAPARDSDDDDFIDLREVWNLLWRRRWTIFIVAGVVLVATIIYTAMMTPIFRASTVLQIERDVGKVMEYAGVTTEERGTNDFYQTQYELLQSRTLARRVIDRLGLYEPGAATPKDDEEPGFIAGMLGSVRGLLSGSQEEPDAHSQDQLPANLEGMLLANLTVSPIPNSRLVRLYYTSPSPPEAALVVNTLAAAFVDMSLERRFEASSYAKGFLEERLKQVRADLEDSERAMLAYTQERGIINQNDKLGILTEKLSGMTRSQIEAQTERFAVESRYQAMLTEKMASLPEIMDSLVIQKLKEQRYDLQAKYEESLQLYKPSYPTMQQMQEGIAQLARELDQEIGHIRDGIKVQYEAKLREEKMLAESIAATRLEILTLEASSIGFKTLKRGVDTNRELYDGLLQRMKEVGVAAGASNNNISVVDRAEIPRGKFAPSMRSNALLALVLGLMLGVGIAFLFEMVDDSIKSPADLEKLLSKPVLGVTPRLDPKESSAEEIALMSYKEPASALAEAYRSMRAALTFSTAEGAPKAMQFTSVGPHEGKTTTAINIAINLSQTGSKVLLIDADLRNPSLHKLFRRPNEAGLTNYLTGNADPAEVTQSLGIPGLFVMTAGPVPPNPAELLHGGKLIDLVALGTQRFDHVIIDSPPLLGLADAVIIADAVQATIMVAGANGTRKGGLCVWVKALATFPREYTGHGVVQI